MPARVDHLHEERARAVLVVAEPLMQDAQDREARVEANEVGERQRAHRVVHAELHDAVHRFGRCDHLVHREKRLVQHRQEDAVRDEAGKIAAQERGFPEVFREGEDGLCRLVRGHDPADHLDERHDGHGIHEVHADEAVRPLRARRETCDRDGRRVRREDRGGRDERVESREQVLFDHLVLNDCLDDEAGLGEPREIGRRDDARERRIAVAGRDLPLVDLAREILLDRLQPFSGEVARHVDEHHLFPGEGGHMRNARSHLSSAHDADGPKCHWISFSFAAPPRGPARAYQEAASTRRGSREAAIASEMPIPARDARPQRSGPATGTSDRSPRIMRPIVSAEGSPKRRSPRAAPCVARRPSTTKSAARPKIFAAASAARSATPRMRASRAGRMESANAARKTAVRTPVAPSAARNAIRPGASSAARRTGRGAKNRSPRETASQAKRRNRRNERTSGEMACSRRGDVFSSESTAASSAVIVRMRPRTDKAAEEFSSKVREPPTASTSPSMTAPRLMVAPDPRRMRSRRIRPDTWAVPPPISTTLPCNSPSKRIDFLSATRSPDRVVPFGTEREPSSAEPRGANPKNRIGMRTLIAWRRLTRAPCQTRCAPTSTRVERRDSRRARKAKVPPETSRAPASAGRMPGVPASAAARASANVGTAANSAGRPPAVPAAITRTHISSAV